MSGGAQVNKSAHRCKNFEEKKKHVASRENQEICGGVLTDLVEKARYTTNRGKTSSTTFRGIYDDKQGQGIFEAERADVGGWTVENRMNVPYASESTT